MMVWSTVADLMDRHGRAALVTVVRAEGSSPREPGARMIVAPDRTFAGTIGGGTLEWQAIEQAGKRLGAAADSRCDVKRFALGPELGQCCGGRVDLLFEVFDAGDRDTVGDLAARESAGLFATRGVLTDRGVSRAIRRADPAAEALIFSGGVLTEHFGDGRRPLSLFGAGHVGRALVLAMAPLPFAVTWFDTRADAFPAHRPGNVACRRLDDPASAVAAGRDGSFALVLTHSHQLDLLLVQLLLTDGRYPFVGLIGSTSKRARFVSRLRKSGLTDADLQSLICPIGVAGIRSKAPPAIAAATAAQLLERDEALVAARRAANAAATA